MAKKIDRSTLPGKEELRNMREAGMSLEKIGNQIGVSPATVKDLLIEYGIYQKGSRAKRTDLPVAETILEEMETMRIAEIARKYNVTVSAVRSKLECYYDKQKPEVYEQWQKVNDWYAGYLRRKHREALRIARKPRKRVITALEVPHGYIY